MGQVSITADALMAGRPDIAGDVELIHRTSRHALLELRQILGVLTGPRTDSGTDPCEVPVGTDGFPDLIEATRRACGSPISYTATGGTRGLAEPVRQAAGTALSRKL
ncbi:MULTISPECIES: hypothetical protein [unclassified Streptomyces]|uniref:hypothetical protein n=1 Tax=unclassified Streptomyces TaxID=2593676 RepID=UPI000DC7B62A|nr:MULTISPECIES: hypothetical protein [unclassified Streptomyces]AWZ07883.1 hypothetical protein DRB89_28385 [Streptomyces sp. ICC4]AWZ15536.1 hypothetical protein DRB96_28405 [Streptomyces sp. ICC1]